MMKYRYIEAAVGDRVGRIALNRPEKHNAMHIGMIRELTSAIEEMNHGNKADLILITGKGKNFCAGADLNWMKEGLQQSEEELYRESLELAMLFDKLNRSPKITLVAVSGKVMGGANGILAASDIAVASSTAVFAFTEVRLGLVPATIVPYVVQRTGESVAREWMLTGREFQADEAYQRGLVNWLVSDVELVRRTEELIGMLLGNGPKALLGVKEMFLKEGSSREQKSHIDLSARLIARFRISEEGQEGISAFFEKRQPRWKR